MAKSLYSKPTSTTIKITGYKELLNNIKSIIDKGLGKAYQAVDNIKVQTYWQIGERIIREELKQKDRAEYGSRIIEILAQDTGFSRRTLFEIVQFYRCYPIVHAVRAQLSWTHYRTLISISNKKERDFYEISIIKNTWSTREFEKRLKSKEYEKCLKSGNIDLSLPSTLPVPQEIFKNTYDWDFLQLEESHTENELENDLLSNIEKVLLEFGSGFAFVGRQKKILIAGQWEKIDLLFYHIPLKCYVIVELKARELQRGDIEQVTRYLTYYRDHKEKYDRDPVALIICKHFDEIDVYYSAGKDRDDIFVAEYKTKLPKASEIKRKLIKSK